MGGGEIMLKPKKAIASLLLAVSFMALSVTAYYVSKAYAVQKIVEHPELSNEKVKAISDMMKEQFDSNK